MTRFILKSLPLSALMSLSLGAYALPRVPLAEIKSQSSLNYAATALGKKYVWAGTSWDSSPQNRGKGNGPDCSGLVLKAWHYPKQYSTQTPLPLDQIRVGGHLVQPRLDTRTMYRGNYQGLTLPWNMSNNYSNAEPGDAYVWKGHTMLVWSRNSNSAQTRTIEAVGAPISKTVHLVRTDAFLKARNTKLMRRDNMSFLQKVRNVLVEKPVQAIKAIFHTVRLGDTLYALARQYRVTLEHILKLNPEVEPTKMQINQKIRVK